jgi:hypothetical protein
MQRITGFLLLLIGAAGVAAEYWTPLGGRPWMHRIDAAFPFFAVLALAFLFFPSPRIERERRGEDLWDRSGVRMITLRWWLVVAVAIAAGCAFHFLLLR